MATTPLDAQLGRVREKLHDARERDPRCKRSGSAKHGYQLGPPLPIGRIIAFESDIGVVLPKDFRRFVVEVGNGGAGPAYGWPRFEPAGAVFRQPAWQTPFRAPSEEDDRVDEPGGSIQLSDHGCGVFDLLVVNGAERGNVWFSDDAGVLLPLPGRDSDSSRGLPADASASVVWRRRLREPANTSRISFIDYYESWLDEVLADGRIGI